VELLFQASARKWVPTEWALRWVWNHPEISTVLSGMGSLDQVRENIAFSLEGKANSLIVDDLAFIEQVRRAYRDLLQVDCSGCAYCMPCPSGVNIPHNFSLYNDLITFKDPRGLWCTMPSCLPSKGRLPVANVGNVRRSVRSISRFARH